MSTSDRLDFDDRLTKVNPSNYRIWHDGQDVAVAKGQSTTKPLTAEKVNVNTKAYGKIYKSYFNRPTVDFTSTNVKVERFDRFDLAIWRDFDNLPVNNPNVDYHDDLGLNALHTYSLINFFADNFTGAFENSAIFRYVEGKTWITDLLHFDKFDLQGLTGSFFMVTNPLPIHKAQGISYTPPNMKLQEENLPVTIIITQAKINNGNSEMRLILHNEEIYFPALGETIIVLKGGE